MRNWNWKLIGQVFGAIVGIATIIAAVIAVLAFLRPGLNSTAGSALQPTSATTVLPTSTPLPTATSVPPRIITENLQIPCTNCGTLIATGSVSLVLDTVTIDTAHQKMLWKFTITNASSDYNLNGMRFSQLSLEDPTARTYTASGQAQDTWNLAPGASTDETPTFTFIPTPNVQYRLKVTISANFDTYAFATETFTF